MFFCPGCDEMGVRSAQRAVYGRDVRDINGVSQAWDMICLRGDLARDEKSGTTTRVEKQF